MGREPEEAGRSVRLCCKCHLKYEGGKVRWKYPRLLSV